MADSNSIDHHQNKIVKTHAVNTVLQTYSVTKHNVTVVLLLQTSIFIPKPLVLEKLLDMTIDKKLYLHISTYIARYICGPGVDSY